MRFPRVRLTVRLWMASVALVAVWLTAYLILVEWPARRRRFLSADQAVIIQIDLLRRAAQHERGRERGEVDRAARLRGDAETDEPARALLWAKSADDALRAAEHAARNADRYQKAADD